MKRFMEKMLPAVALFGLAMWYQAQPVQADYGQVPALERIAAALERIATTLENTQRRVPTPYGTCRNHVGATIPCVEKP